MAKFEPVDAGPPPVPLPSTVSAAGAADVAVDARAWSAACRGTAWATTLVPQAQQPAPPARAIWLDARHLHRPGAAPPAGHRVRLLAARAPTIVAAPGAPASGFDAALPLAARDGAWTPAWRARFPHVAAGVTWALDAVAAAQVAELLRGQLLLVEEDARGDVVAVVGAQPAGALDDRYADAAADDAPPLGAHPAPDATTFRLWAPTARFVGVCLHARDDDASFAEAHAMRRDDARGTWSIALPGDRRGAYYTYVVDVVVPGVGLVRQRVTDPYAISLGTDSARAWIGRLDDPALEPAGWRSRPRRVLASNADLSVYELHVRDFSASDPTVPPAHRGRYLAFTHASSAGMRHLRALARAGLKDVHLLPVFDFATVPDAGAKVPAIDADAVRRDPASPQPQAAVAAVADQDAYNWGYDPFHFDAPEGSYATDASDGAVRIRELRAMVLALNRAGLRVGMDVVYNHMSASGQHPKSVLDRIVPGYYHRLDVDGAVEQSTCCANTATEHAMMGRLLVDSVRRWARDHGMQSFRFDLMGHQPRALMLTLKRKLREDHGHDIPLLGEGWNFGEVADGARFVQASQASLAGTGIATFSDRARDALRGGGVGDDAQAMVARQGVLNGLGYAPNEKAPAAQGPALAAASDLVRLGLAGTTSHAGVPDAAGRVRRGAALFYAGRSGAGYAAEPTEVVNYVENHDNHTLWDLNALKLPLETPGAARARVQVLGLAFTLLSQGIPYVHAGSELLRSKSLDGNSYDAGDWFNRYDVTGGDTGWARGLPGARDNRALWPTIADRFARANLRPSRADVAFTAQALRDWLAVRSSTRMLRLRSAREVEQRLTLHPTGDAHGVLYVGEVDGERLAGARYARLLYAVNVDVQPREVVLPAIAGRRWRLHPVLASARAADPRARDARLDRLSGRLAVPPRTAVVWVADPGR